MITRRFSFDMQESNTIIWSIVLIQERMMARNFSALPSAKQTLVSIFVAVSSKAFAQALYPPIACLKIEACACVE